MKNEIKEEKLEVEVVEKEVMNDLLNLKNYQSYIDSINGSISTVANSFVRIGRDLTLIKKDKLYAIDGYKDIYEFAKAKFDFGNTSTKNFINVYTRFGNTEASYGCLKDEYEEYSLSQLIELLPVSDEDMKKYKPDQTVEQIREVKKISQMSDQNDNKYFKEFNKMAEKVRSMFVEQLNLDSITSDISFDVNSMKYEDVFSFTYLDEKYRYVFRLTVYNHQLNYTIEYACRWYSGCIYEYDQHFTTLIEKAKKGFKSFISSAKSKQKEKEEKKKAAAKEKENNESCTLKTDNIRKDFINTINNWNLLSDLPDIEMKVYQFSVIPNYIMIVFGENKYYYATKGSYSNYCSSSIYDIVEALKDMKY